MTEPITTEAIRAAAPGTMFGQWRRYECGVALTRMVGGVLMTAEYKSGMVLWTRCVDRRYTSTERGECPTWEAAMAAAEDSAKRVFVDALVELGAEVL